MRASTRWGLIEPLDALREPLQWPERLLIVGPVGLGDTVLSLPAVRRIQQASPRTKMTWIGRAAYAPIVAMMNVHAFQPAEALIASGFDFTDFGAVLSFADVGADFFGGMKQLSAVPVRIGRAAARSRPRCWNHIVFTSRFGWPRHEAQRDLRLLLPFGAGAPASLEDLRKDCHLRLPAATYPADLPAQGHVVLHPYSMGHGREWPLTHWIELARLLAQDGIPVVLTGSAADRERLAQAWPQTLRPAGVSDASGRLDFLQLSALLHGAAAMSAASTGPLHLAAALGTPALGLFAPRKGVAIDRWAALGRAAVSVQAHRRCARPRCKNDNCACMAALAPQRVALALQPGRQRRLNTEALAPYVIAAPALQEAIAS